MPVECDFDPLIELSGRAHSGIPFYPPSFFDGQQRSDQDVLSEALKRDRIAKQLSLKLDLANWVAVNQMISVPIESWIGADEWTQKYGLHPLIKRAIALEVEKVASDIKSERDQAQKKLEMEKLQLRQQFDYGKPNHTFNRLFQ